ncbi:MAG: hypothetical protein A2X28_10895 [Elusimicrobia bacterium GWA2_56_46]|nr:MAG: hypothetical protein A2X28_10895 [Elusimicrobia bacterium GWA2_56_46]OGR55771.1 MAG: hypothetical protein A2X39_10515 [Elusimicrobia bacterium GWC2_56_31]HBB66644.1 glycosyl hydrolase family 16 [Elusimicrobiota bacterium]HBW23581.1 glycosyl hydrolase family 16 [Elusimicrobiota bacterium]
MRHRISRFLLTVFVMSAASFHRAEAADPDDRSAGEGWRLTWSDEFNGEALDLKNWSYELGGGGWGNQELQIYTANPENIRVENGSLVLQALYNGGGADGYNYTSSRILSLGKSAVQYGKIAARIKLPRGQGPWPAFWLLGENIQTVGWPECGEIDIMESGGYGGRDLITGAIHFKGETGYHSYFSKRASPSSGTSYDSYHTYEIEWDNKRVSWFMDGEKYFERPITGPYMRAFHKPFFLLLNLAVGGPDTPYTGRKSPDTTVFPQSMYVDWIRVYEKYPEDK